MKTLNGQSGDMTEQSSNVETYWVVDVFGQNDKVKRKSRRPPTYNPDEYVIFLRKLLSTNGGAVERLYGNGVVDAKATSTPATPDVSEVLRKLRQDLTFSFVSFSREFASDACDGISLLMDVLRAVQLAQNQLNGNNKEAGSQAGRSNRRSLIRTASTDELEVMLCLNQLCLANGHVPGKDFGCSRLLAHSAGFYGLALALVSHLTRTRSLALRLLTALCQMKGGHVSTSEALTTLRLNMGEPVRLKLLCGIINSSVSRVETLIDAKKNERGAECADASLAFLVEGVAFLNAFVQSAPNLRNKVVIQWEVEEANLNVQSLSQVADTAKSPLAVQLKRELALWADNLINIAVLLDRVNNVTNTNEALRKDLSSLRSRLLDLEQEKRRFSQFECDMKKRCEDLQEELTTLRSTSSTSLTSTTSATSSVAIQTARDDLSSSDTSSDGEDYDIDDVIRELNCIVDDAECDLRMESSSTTSISTSVSSCSTTEEDLLPIPSLPRLRTDRKPPTRISSPRTLAESVQSVRLDADLNGETSDYPTADAYVDSDMEQTPPTRISRKKISRIFDVDSERAFDDDDNDVGMEDVDQADAAVHSIDCSEESGSDQVIEDVIQPDILRTIPARLYRSVWNVVEARSPVFNNSRYRETTDDEMTPEPMTKARMHPPKPRRRHQSMDNISSMDSVPQTNAVYIHPTVQHSSMEDCRAGEIIYDNSFAGIDHSGSQFAMTVRPDDVLDSGLVDPTMADLQIGDVFSFQNSNHGHPQQHPHIRNARKVKQMAAESDSSREDKSRGAFTFSNLIPAFLKSSFGNSAGAGGGSGRDSAGLKTRDEWDPFQTEKALMKDYRQHFQAHPAQPGSGHHPEFWPASFQALPFRNIPQWNVPFNGRAPERATPILLPSPAELHMQINRMTKLMDHPAGMY